MEPGIKRQRIERIDDWSPLRCIVTYPMLEDVDAVSTRYLLAANVCDPRVVIRVTNTSSFQSKTLQGSRLTT